MTFLERIEQLPDFHQQIIDWKKRTVNSKVICQYEQTHKSLMYQNGYTDIITLLINIYNNPDGTTEYKLCFHRKDVGFYEYVLYINYYCDRALPQYDNIRNLVEIHKFFENAFDTNYKNYIPSLRYVLRGKDLPTRYGYLPFSLIKSGIDFDQYKFSIKDERLLRKHEKIVRVNNFRLAQYERKEKTLKGKGTIVWNIPAETYIQARNNAQAEIDRIEDTYMSKIAFWVEDYMQQLEQFTIEQIDILVALNESSS